MITGKELAEKVLKQVTEHPERHNQAIWVENSFFRVVVSKGNLCGTRACLAGWAVLFNRKPNETPMQTLWRLGEGFGLGVSTDWERVAVKLLLPEKPIVISDEGLDVYDDQQGALTDAFYTGGDTDRAIDLFRRALLDWVE
jgi:hypothetical protein